MKYLYIIYQYLIAIPLILVITLFTALVTVICFPWKNGAFPHAVQVFWSRSIIRLLLVPIKVTGQKNIRKGQSYVFVSNHQSFLDVFAIYGWLPANFKWLMKNELRRVPLVGFACKVAGHIFVDRANPVAALRSIKEIEAELQNGVSTVIFPEGTRTKTGEMGRFKRGAFQVALDLHLPIIPISLTGFYDAMPRDTYYVRPRAHLCMHIGKPIDLSDFIDPMTSQIDPNAAMAHVRELVQEGMKQSE